MRYRGELKRNFSHVLREFVKNDKQSVWQLSKATGIKERTIRAHLNGQNGVYYEHQCLYMTALGPEFVTALFKLWGYRAVPLTENDDHACTRRVGEVVGEFVYEKAKADADGVIDRKEASRLARIANKTATWLAGFSFHLKARAQ